MASEINVWVVNPELQAASKVAAAQQVFRRVEAGCTRFDPDSPLMQANRAGRSWWKVPTECVDAVEAAAIAHRETAGLFDPRVLDTLQSLGYRTSLPFERGKVQVAGSAGSADLSWRRQRQWKPGIDHARGAVRIGRVPIDLGGIGKGLAVRWAGAQLRGAGSAILVEAGGDCWALGAGPEGEGWAIAVEDPFGGSDPVAVLRLTDRAVATSSIRLRHWTIGGRSVHHLIDPRTQESASSDLVAVTVVGDDPADAEVWSKALFVAGRAKVRQLADDSGLAALWVDAGRRLCLSRQMGRYVAWQVTHAS